MVSLGSAAQSSNWSIHPAIKAIMLRGAQHSTLIASACSPFTTPITAHPAPFFDQLANDSCPPSSYHPSIFASYSTLFSRHLI